jgi:hypothetical protein
VDADAFNAIDPLLDQIARTEGVHSAGVAASIWTVAVDEVPNFQVLERQPIPPAIPGRIEQQEFTRSARSA